jgi:hypothetical protein
VGFWPIVAPPLPTFSDPFSSRTVLAPTIGSEGATEAPSGGASAALGSYSAALFGLNENAAATSCAPAAFSAAMSPPPEASGSAGPLTVARLLRMYSWCGRLLMVEKISSWCLSRHLRQSISCTKRDLGTRRPREEDSDGRGAASSLD